MNDITTTYYVPGVEVTSLKTAYSFVNNQSEITPPVVSFYARTMTRGTDYEIYIDGVLVPTANIPTVSTVGNHAIKIQGVVGNYGGSQTTIINIVNYNTWSIVQSTLADASLGERIITLNADITPENPKNADMTMEVNGTVVLNLNGKTIDRGLFSKKDSIVKGQVIRVNSGANLTINGEGIITGGFNWAESDEEGGINDGGGIYNAGSLTLNNVTLKKNKCVKKTFFAPGTTNPNTSNTARGGGVYSSGSLIIKGGEIVGNEARGGGGGVYGKDAKPFVMKFVTVSSNISESKGGGIRVRTTGSTTAVIDTCEISYNFVTDKKNVSKGAGIYMEGGNLVMNKCDIIANQSTMNGSGIFLAAGKITAVNCTIEGNGSYFESNENLGGGAYLSSGTFIMDGGIIANNNSIKNGGGIYVGNGAVFQVKGDVVIKDNLQAWAGEGFSNNNAYLAGSSVIDVVGELGDDALINITPHDAGGVYVRFAEGVSGQASLSHFKLDNIGYSLMLDSDNNIEIYKPFLWNNTDTWDGTIATDLSGNLPTASTDLIINRAVKIPNGYTAYADNITFGTYGSIIIEDGGQFITGKPVAVSGRKNVVAAKAGNKTGWYLISSPVNNPSIKNNTNLITEDAYSDPTYDLYRYNEVKDLQWENYRNMSHTDFTTLESGRGYLYRNLNNYVIYTDGTMNVSDVSCDLSYHATTSPSGNVNTLIGFNIIGNPYSHTIYKGVETEDVHPAIPNGTLLEGKYYVLDAETGKWALTDDGTAIPPMTGILVQAKSAGTLTMKNSTEGEVVPESKNSRANGADRKNIWFTVANSNYEDRTCVEFREGHGLNKIEHLNEEAPMLYIRHNGEDFASVDMNPEAKMFNLNFEAKTMGYYTLSVETQGEYSYLHLIDKVTEKEIDLLEENEYTFIGSTSDAANRFIVRMSLAEDPEESDNEVFAYQSGDEIVVTGEGELQVFDVMGRFVATYNVSGVQTVTKPITAGVYIVKLNEKTQKIIIK